MAIPMPKVPGYVQMMKEGSRTYSGLEEAVMRNIEACTELARTMKTTYGPKGLNKMIINHIEKLFVTNDAATIMNQLEIQHPAAKLMLMASQMQEQEVGDGTNLVVILIGNLLEGAGELIKMGLKPVEIIDGYELARDAVLDTFLPACVTSTVTDVTQREKILPALKTSIMSKQLGLEDHLAELVADACIATHTQGSPFNVDNVRVCKIVGCGAESSGVFYGMVFKRVVEGTVTKATGAKVAVYTCPIDISTTETKGTVLLKTADELLKFSEGEESLLEAQIKGIKDAGVGVIVSGGKFGDMALHYCNKYGIMAVRLMSKFDVRRVAKTVGASPLPKLEIPSQEHLGFCQDTFIDEVGGTPVVKFQPGGSKSKVATIIVRGSTDSVMDDIERALDDGINTFKALTTEGRLVNGAGAVEMQLAVKLNQLAETIPGMEQYAVVKFSEAFQLVVKAIADNAGTKGHEVSLALLSAHESGKVSSGVDVMQHAPTTMQADGEQKVVDLFATKYWAIKYASQTAATILAVDMIICAKQAGGPKPRQGGGDWDQD